MTINILIFLAGITGLTFGANMLVSNSSSIAAHYKIRPFIIGATIIAFGTSAPELVVSLAAAIKGTKSIALGNILGSNIANIGLILGAISIISVTLIKESVLKKEIPLMIIVSGLLYLLSLDGIISRLDGAVLFTGIILFTYNCISSHKKEPDDAQPVSDDKADAKVGKNILFAVIGLAFLVGGAHFMVESAVKIALSLGISQLFIGITMVAIGTSLPEFAASAAAIIQKKGDMSIGNIVGSNIFNVLLVLGLVSMVQPVPVEKGLLHFEYPVMLSFAVLLYIMGKRRNKVSKTGGVFMLILYFLFIAILYKYRLS